MSAETVAYVPAVGHVKVKLPGGTYAVGMAMMENPDKKSWLCFVDGKQINVNVENMFAVPASLLKALTGGGGLQGEAIKKLHEERAKLVQDFPQVSSIGMNKLNMEDIASIRKKCESNTYVPTLYWEEDVIHTDNIPTNILEKMFAVAKEHGYSIQEYVPEKRERKTKETAK